MPEEEIGNGASRLPHRLGIRPVSTSFVGACVCAQEVDDFMSIYEPIFYQNGVDAVFGGHAHAYERSFPLYNFTGERGLDCHK